MTYTATILRAQPGRRLAKLYTRPDAPPADYNAGELFGVREVAADDFWDFVVELASLGPDECLIRGEPTDEARGYAQRGEPVRRLMHDRPECRAAFVPARKPWIVLDADQTDVPWDPADPGPGVTAWRASLPAPFSTAQAAFLLSASAHRSPTVRGKLLVALASPIDNPTAEAWARACGCDPSVCRTVQPNYVAAPIFRGCTDPLPDRTPLPFDGAPAVLPRLPDGAGRAGAGRALGAAEPLAPPEYTDRVGRVWAAVRDRWDQGGRVEGNAALHLFGWLLGAGWSKGELAALLELLDEGEDPDKAREHMHILGNARAIDGPGAVREWAGAAWRAIDDAANPLAAEIRERARLRATRADDDEAGDGVGDLGAIDEAVEAVIGAVADARAGVFQRSGALVHVARDPLTIDGQIVPAGKPTIHELSQARLREIISTTSGPRSESLAPKVMARREWRGVRPLDGVSAFPLLRPDGSVLLRSGYDDATRTIATIADEVADLPGLDAPTRDDARRALALLDDLVSDFPFDGDASRAAWVAMLLSVLARPAIDGPVPLGLLDASARAAGKTLLADLISVITTGERVPRTVAPKTREEWDKSMLTWLSGGAPIVLLDNVTGLLSSDALDAVLTGSHYTQRVLGATEERRVAVRATFLASANNCRISTDLVRRSIRCRLEPDVERPEERTGFRYPRILAHARQHRAEYLAAALTVLRAYAIAGRPRVEARTVGSFESWSETVRDALVWAGGADPVATQDELRDSADVERDEVRDLLAAWHALIGDRAVTVREVLDAAAGRMPEGAAAAPSGPFPRASAAGEALADALRALAPPGSGGVVSPRSAGNRLRTLRGQIVGGLVLRPGRDARGGWATWQVVAVS